MTLSSCTKTKNTHTLHNHDGKEIICTIIIINEIIKQTIHDMVHSISTVPYNDVTSSRTLTVSLLHVGVTSKQISYTTDDIEM